MSFEKFSLLIPNFYYCKKKLNSLPYQNAEKSLSLSFQNKKENKKGYFSYIIHITYTNTYVSLYIRIE